MRRIFRIFLFVAALATCFGTMYAQNGNKQRLTREQLAEAQAKHIAEEMAMSDETSKQFVDTYCRYQKEIWALGPRSGKQRRSGDSSVKTEEETGQAIKDRFAHSQKILDIRKKYYEEYSKFLTQKQIQRVYDLEKQMMNRLSKHGRRGNGRR